MIKIILFSIIPILFLSSCSEYSCSENKEDLLNSLDELVLQISEDSLLFDSPKWGKYDRQFTNMMIDCYPLHKENMSTAEKGSIISKCIHYYYYHYGDNLITALINKKITILEQIKKEPEVFTDGISQYINETWNIGFALDIPPEDLYQLVDKTISFLEDHQKEIKDVSTVGLFILKCFLEGV